MASIYDAFFILQFLIVIGIMLYKLYNVMSFGEVADIKIVWVTFVVYLISYVIGFIAFLNNPEIMLYLMLFRLETWFLLFTVILLISELLIHLSRSVNVMKKARFSKEV